MARHARRRILQGSLALAGFSLLAGCGLVTLPGRGPKRPARVGYLSALSPNARTIAAFREGMQAQGFREDQDYVLESRYAEGRSERLPDLAAELVNLPVDVVLAEARLATTAAKQATATVPIVMAAIGSDPVALGLTIPQSVLAQATEIIQ